MKKLLLALLALPLLASFASCSSDDDMPQVNIDLTYGNASVIDGQVYVVQPDTFRILSVAVTPVREGHKATNGPVSYFMNGVPVGTSPVAPFGVNILTSDLKPGAYAVQMFMPVYEEGCELANAVAQIQLNVLADSTQLPSAAVPSVTQRVEYSFE